MTIDEILNYVTETPENTNRAVLKDMLNQLDGGGTTPSKLILNEAYAGYNSTMEANMSPYEIIGIFADGAESIPTEYISIDSSTGNIIINDPNAYLTTNGEYLDSYTLNYHSEWQGQTYINNATIMVTRQYGTLNGIKDKNSMYIYYD